MMMGHDMAAVSGQGSELASWSPLITILGVFAVIVTALFVFGRSGDSESRTARLLLRIPNDLEKVTGLPGWAVAMIGLSLYGLLVAGEGFYSDVAWHVALGRDEQLFTAPHTSIVIGLGLILLSGVVGILIASLKRIDTALRWRNVRIPWSTLPMLALGAAAVSGFPLDELWHRAYGIDVTMWSPTHMLMIFGASLTGLAAWLVLADAGVAPRDSRWSTGIHAVAAWLTLQGLAAPLGEFAFGVPQFQHIFHPVIVCIAAGFALVAMRLVIGRGWALGITTVNLLLMQADLLGGGEGGGPVDTRDVGLFVVSAATIELLAWVLGTDRRTRFAVASGLAVGTVGLAGEWWYNAGAYQPWQPSLLPDAVLLGIAGAIGAALVAAAFARAAGRQVPVRPVPSWAVAAGAVAVVTVAVLPLPRHVGDVTAAVDIERVSEGRAHILVELDPRDAAADARWFQATAWQGGGLVLSDLVEVAPGSYRTEEPVPVEGRWKTLVRLHRGSELMTMPVYLPADPEIGEPEIPAEARTGPMESETDYLLRETHAGVAWFAPVVYGILLAALATWAAAFTLAAVKIAPRRDEAARAWHPGVPAATGAGGAEGASSER